MNKEHIIRELRGLLVSGKLDQQEYEAVCSAIRELGGNP